MKNNKSSNWNLFSNLLSKAGITLNGDKPWDIQIKDERTFDKVIESGSLGFGEAYMENMWECDSIDEMISRVLKAKIDQKITTSEKLKIGAKKIKSFLNPQSIKRVKEDVPFHYDLGNDVFENMLDKYMTYTCAYFKDTEDLEEAQENKLDLVCKKMGLKPGMRILDIGCGWGSFMKYAAQNYGVICDGLTLSKEQKKMGEEKCASLPINFILQDYREYEPTTKYDRIISIGMVEHVGPENYKDFFVCANKFLKEDGLFLLHTIGGVVSSTTADCDPWIRKYIFPNGVIPSVAQLGSSMEKKFNLEDLHNIGAHYDKTLVAWFNNFDDSWDQISEKYGEKFYRMWKYYLLSCAGAFRSRDLNTWQLVLSKIGTEHPTFSRAV